MQAISAAGTETTTQDRRLLWLLLLVPVVISLVGVWTLDHSKVNKPLFSMTNLVGPTTQSLLAGNGLTVCTEDMGTRGNSICFHAARMPMTAMVVGLGMRLFGDHYLRVACFKTLLFLLPIELCLYLVWRCLPQSRWGEAPVVVLLLAPFAITAFLADVTNILVDEGYSYSFLAAAVALLFFGWQWPSGLSSALLFGLAVDGLYLAKSGMLPVVVVLLVAFLFVERRSGLRWLVVLMVAAAPVVWALHQHHASGRYSVGTSLDGINLHKGNNAGFLEHYPPPHGDSMDWYDFELNRNLYFGDEWSFNDYHQRAALDYLHRHPRETLEGDVRKLNILFFSFEKYGSTASYGVRKLIEVAGMVVFRLMLWAALTSSVYLVFRSKDSADRSLRLDAGIFLAVVAACVLPYVAGFAYTRHVSILIYPAALFCCRVLYDQSGTHNTNE
jgi:multisubunit Na+/H+ antiporter MnhF subunit